MDSAADADDTASSLTSSGTAADETASLSPATAVADGWMFDYVFLRVCRCFKERNLDDFNAALNILEAIIVNRSSPLRADQAQKKKIAAFLTRIMHGKDVDVKFEDDDHMLPLMSAVNIWKSIKSTVTEDGLFENICNLLLVQAVAVCLEKGQTSQARSVLKWLTERHDIARNFATKLSVIMCRADVYHPFLLNFSFDRLLQAVQGYLDAYLERNPSDFLLKAATKVVQSQEVKEESVAIDDRLSETIDDSLSDIEPTRNSTEDFESMNEGQTTPLRRNKKQLLPKDQMLMCKPDSHKNPSIRFSCIPKNTASRLTCEGVCPKSPDKSPSKSELRKPRKKRKKWTFDEDVHLKSGVLRHGVGKWAKILEDSDFKGRTSVMLKDRWRVLTKNDKAG